MLELEYSSERAQLLNSKDSSQIECSIWFLHQRAIFLLSSEFRFEYTVVPVTPADCVAKSVYVRDLPFEVAHESIVSVFSTYYHKEFPAICTGTRNCSDVHQ